MIARLTMAAVLVVTTNLAQAGGYNGFICNNGYCQRISNYGYAQQSQAYSPNTGATTTDPTTDAERFILNIATKRDKWEADQRAAQAHSARISALIDKLGLEGNFRWEAYGAAAHYGVFPQSAYIPNTQQGSTVYQNGMYGSYQNSQGQYAQQPVVQQYEPLNVNTLLQAASRMPGDALKMAELGHQRLVTLSSDLTSEQAEAQRMLAARDLIQALRAPGQQQRHTYQLQIQENGQPVVTQQPAMPPVAANTPLSPAFVLQTRCVACHAGPTNNGIDLTNWDNLTQEQVGAVMARITSPDPEKRMPKSQDGSPGSSLSLPELQAMFCDAKVGALTYQLRQAPRLLGPQQLQLK